MDLNKGNGETIAVTGATGYLAEKLISTLIAKGYKVNAIARNEGNLVALKSKFRDVNLFPCSIDDYALTKKAMMNCIGVFHLAAFKSVTMAEEHPIKLIQTNITGSLNILNISLECPGIKFVITTSTDKAAKVSGVYGASKLMLEKLFEEYETINSKNCAYRTVRYGNVLYSTGSILVKWKLNLETGKEIIVTDPDATRFFWTRDEAVDMLFDCLESANDAKPLIPEMKSITINELLNLMIKKYGGGKPPVIKYIGLQPGENKHEHLDEVQSSDTAERWKPEELYELL